MLPADLLQLAKIKRDPKSEKFEITLDVTFEGGTLSGSYETKAVPHPHLVVALGKLAGPFIEICELKDSVEVEDVDVRTVSISHPADGGRGVIITAVRKLKNGQAMTINTPLRFCELGENASEEDERRLPDRTVKLIDRLIEEARLFVTGRKRGQVEMFEGDEPEGAGPVGPENEPTEGEKEEWDQGSDAWRGEPEPAAAEVTVPPEEGDDLDELLNPSK